MKLKELVSMLEWAEKQNEDNDIEVVMLTEGDTLQDAGTAIVSVIFDYETKKICLWDAGV